MRRRAPVRIDESERATGRVGTRRRLSVFCLPVVVCLALGCLRPASSRAPDAPTIPPGEDIDRGIVRELNLVRSNPAAYADIVESWIPLYRGKLLHLPGRIPILTEEGVEAAREAVGVLRATRPMPRLRFSSAMSRGAADHVADQGPRGTTGHQGSDRSQAWDRVSRYGVWSGGIAENISYGRRNARETVVSLLIDDGVPDRGHRAHILTPDYRVVGAACGPHARYDSMCVTVFTAAYAERESIRG